MAAQNYVLLERVTVGEAGASSITFNSIPQTGYTDLKVVVSARDNDTIGSYVAISFNGVTTNLSSRLLRGSGSAVVSQTETTLVYSAGNANSYTASTFGNSEFYIPNYTSANYKSISADGTNENNATASYMYLTAGLWSSTAAITSITLTPGAPSFKQYSSFSLYGLAAVGTTPTRAPKATGGSIIQTDGTYWYHAFLASGTFTPAVGLSCDYLVVAGGGGAGDMSGGGAGGLRSTVTATGGGGSLESAISVSAQAYTITVGAGGAGVNAGATVGTIGSNSVFSTITSTGGGYGGGYGPNTPAVGNGGNGGSGGGSIANTTGGTPGTGTANQGFGGSGKANAVFGQGGGGGGAGAAPTVIGNGSGDNGGIGVAISAFATATSTGVSNYYAGGGAGSSQAGYAQGIGGSGGGGNGRVQNGASATSGTANTGGGGGGTYFTNGLPSGAGGSGIVIIRYAV